jgi:hypothetical protein
MDARTLSMGEEWGEGGLAEGGREGGREGRREGRREEERKGGRPTSGGPQTHTRELEGLSQLRNMKGGEGGMAESSTFGSDKDKATAESQSSSFVGSLKDAILNSLEQGNRRYHSTVTAVPASIGAESPL